MCYTCIKHCIWERQVLNTKTEECVEEHKPVVRREKPAGFISQICNSAFVIFNFRYFNKLSGRYCYCYICSYCYVCSLLLCMFCSVHSVCIVATDTLRLLCLRFFRAFSSVVRQMSGYNSQRWGTARTLFISLTTLGSNPRKPSNQNC